MGILYLIVIGVIVIAAIIVLKAKNPDVKLSIDGQAVAALAGVAAIAFIIYLIIEWVMAPVAGIFTSLGTFLVGLLPAALAGHFSGLNAFVVVVVLIAAGALVYQVAQKWGQAIAKHALLVYGVVAGVVALSVFMGSPTFTADQKAVMLLGFTAFAVFAANQWVDTGYGKKLFAYSVVVVAVLTVASIMENVAGVPHVLTWIKNTFWLDVVAFFSGQPFWVTFGSRQLHWYGFFVAALAYAAYLPSKSDTAKKTAATAFAIGFAMALLPVIPVVGPAYARAVAWVMPKVNQYNGDVLVVKGTNGWYYPKQFGYAVDPYDGTPIKQVSLEELKNSTGWFSGDWSISPLPSITRRAPKQTSDPGLKTLGKQEGRDLWAQGVLARETTSGEATIDTTTHKAFVLPWTVHSNQHGKVVVTTADGHICDLIQMVFRYNNGNGFQSFTFGDGVLTFSNSAKSQESLMLIFAEECADEYTIIFTTS